MSKEAALLALDKAMGNAKSMPEGLDKVIVRECIAFAAEEVGKIQELVRPRKAKPAKAARAQE